MAMPAVDTTHVTIPTEGDFPVNDNEQQDDYLPAHDVADVGARLIATCHELAHLHTARITYLWKREGGKSGGKLTLGKCKAVSGLERYWSESDFVIWLAADHAQTFNLDQRQIEALIFHELMHADIDDETARPKVRPHDVEAFVPEIERYGLWTSDLKDAGDAMRQAALPMAIVAYGVRA